MSDYYSEDEYNYESDGSTTGYESDETMESCENMPLPNVDHLIPENVEQYQWTKWCLQMANVFAGICCYDVEEENHTISFIHNKKGFSLSVPLNSADYPFIPPTVSWIGEYIAIPDLVLIIHNKQLSIKNWNICTDMTKFVANAVALLRSSVATFISANAASAILGMIKVLGIEYDFDSNKNNLPTFDFQKRFTVEDSHYLREGEKIVKIQSNEERFGKYIEDILKDKDAVQECGMTSIISQFVFMIANAQFTKLEVSMNEAFYRNLLLVNNEFRLNLDLSHLNKIIDALDNIDMESNEKVFFVEDFESHAFKNSVSLVRSKFVKRIMSEVEALRDAVKDFHGYVAISETNVQLIKLMFIPDYDTPYAGGYFEFDVFINGNYPNSPPKVQFLTTASGKIRFNPNLYNCGKVCLSILNTWASNQWNPQSSTLTQVVLSINSMIFIEHPYTNEPAYYDALKTEVGRARSEQYNVQIRRNTIYAAIKQQLRNQATPFKDIISKHWEMNGETTKKHYLGAFGLLLDV